MFPAYPWHPAEADKIPDLQKLAEECISCEEKQPKNECPESKRDCGHHCNHSWIHDECCWCSKVFDEEE